MKKPDKIVTKETLYIASFEIFFSIILQLVFILTKHWNYTVLLGNILSGALAVANFFFMGVALEHAITKDEKQAFKHFLNAAKNGNAEAAYNLAYCYEFGNLYQFFSLISTGSCRF